MRDFFFNVVTYKTIGRFIKSLLSSTCLPSWSADNITVFAPTDAALARVPADQLAALTSNPTELQKVLGYHALLEDVKGLHRRGIGRLHDKVIISSNGLPIRINVYRLVHVSSQNPGFITVDFGNDE